MAGGRREDRRLAHRPGAVRTDCVEQSCLKTNVLAISKVAAKLGCHKNPTRARAGIVDYALVLSAWAMMLFNAATVESPDRVEDRSERCRRDRPDRVLDCDVYTTASGRTHGGTGKSPTRTSRITNPLNIRLGARGQPVCAATRLMPKPRYRAIEPLASHDPRNSSASRTNCSWY
jgi:hypothetical protein